MKLINRTTYDADQLRELFKLCLEALHGDPSKTVEVVYSRRRGDIGGAAHLGRAAIHSARKPERYHARLVEHGELMIALPGPSYPPADARHVAQVFEHELAHNRGLHHGDMREDLLYSRQAVSWIIPFLQRYGDRLKRKDDPRVMYGYRCPKGHPEIYQADVEVNIREYGKHAATSCSVIVQGPSSWRPGSNVGPWLCGERLIPLLRRLRTPGDPPTLDAAREARAKLAEKREAQLRERLAEAEKRLNRIKAHVAKLRIKVRYYDRKAASASRNVARDRLREAIRNAVSKAAKPPERK